MQIWDMSKEHIIRINEDESNTFPESLWLHWLWEGDE